MVTRPLGAQISHMLKARDVDVIFGIPGVHNIEMYRGIEEAGITHILARHEQGAGFMADGYARASGKPGVCYIITGPGLCNAMTPLGQAYSDSVPVLAISSCLDRTAGRRGQLHQMLDQEAAAATVCDWSHEAVSAEDAYTLIDRALGEFNSARKRPKHIQVPIALAGAEAKGFPARGKPLEVVQEAKIGPALGDLLDAKKVLFVLGGGAAHVGPLASEVIEAMGAASFTTYAGRGIIPAHQKHHFGSFLARPTSADVAAEADYVVAVGTELSEVDLWRDALGHECPMLRVDIDPEVLAGAENDLALDMDAAAFFTALKAALVDHHGVSDWDDAAVQAQKLRWRGEVDAERPGIVPVAEALREVLPEDTMIYSDMTQFAYSSKEFWDMARPGHWHHPSGFGTLGYALPAAIGGAVARQGLPTVAIAGDYGFQYTVQELGTAVELGLPLPILLWDNGKLKEIEDAMVASQIAPKAVVAQNPDFCRLAEAYGALSAAPKTLGALQEAVKAALKADRPTLIHMTADLAT
ncbi:thiamine pyrophosphate-binding protein [Shimia aestuarii]|uniref:thiamine pyrophosphate-binding protein n=1 Tax=Shimia aestuarii TaxID=254406 RepID=UPI001FB3D695|nr:thiamine pyrophosphate-binding protein [Shimia aestuarii]